MMRKHKITADMVKQFLNVIEGRIERANQKPSPVSNRLNSRVDRATI